jgi:hypothetical protein
LTPVVSAKQKRSGKQASCNKVGLMTDAMDSAKGVDSRPRRNWWKTAFFVVLIAFELMREVAVLAGAEGARPNARALLFSNGGYVKAQGSWKRIDGGGTLVPGTVTIECQRETGRCLEASVMVSEQYVYAPEIDWFDARFLPDAVSYENDLPDCARYSVRLDLKMQKVFAVRDRKENPSNPNCANLERRIEMQLGDGFEPDRDSLDGHFVPIIQGLAALAELL